MGLDVVYQAVPGDGRLLAMAVADVANGEDLAMVHYWLHHPESPAIRRRFPSPIRDAVEEMARRDPAFAGVHCALDRVWDVVHYLLSATRRRELAAERDRLIDLAFVDVAPPAEHLRCTQGSPILYLSPVEVRAVARVLESTSRGAFMAHYDPVRMEDAGVYKFFAERQPADAWPLWPVAYFDALRAFFARAAAGGYAVVRRKD